MGGEIGDASDWIVDGFVLVEWAVFPWIEVIISNRNGLDFWKNGIDFYKMD